MTVEALAKRPTSLRERLRASSAGQLVRVAGWALVVAVVAAWVIFLRPGFLGGPATYVIVAGHSMEPNLHSGDVVVARRQRTYRRGDVVAYRIMEDQAGAGALIIHRIVGGSAHDGFMTRGDNRNYRDPWRPKPVDIAGRMEVHVPRLGMLPIFSHTIAGMALIAALAGLLVFLGGSSARAGSSRQ